MKRSIGYTNGYSSTTAYPHGTIQVDGQSFQVTEVQDLKGHESSSCWVLHTSEGLHALQSYDTIVAVADCKGQEGRVLRKVEKVVKRPRLKTEEVVFMNWSNTTARQISWFNSWAAKELGTGYRQAAAEIK